MALSLVLIGVSGSGKSTVGLRLAQALDGTFLEGDSFHSPGNVAKMRAGTPLDDADRWPWLEALGQAIGTHVRAGRPVVVACSALRRSYRDALSRAACQPLTFVQLAIDPATLAARIGARQQHFMPASLLQSQVDTFEPLQTDEDGTVVWQTGSPLQAVETIRQWLARRASRPQDRHEKGRQRRPFVEEPGS